MILVGVAIGLFLAAFITKRRFGVLGLGLAAGVVLAQYSAGFVAEQLRTYHIGFGVDSYQALAAIIVTVLPAIFLLAGGPIYTGRHSSMIGAVGFAIFGTALIVGPFSTLAPAADRAARDVMVMIMNRQSFIIISGIVLALVDIFMIHSSAAKHQKASKH